MDLPIEKTCRKMGYSFLSPDRNKLEASLCVCPYMSIYKDICVFMNACVYLCKRFLLYAGMDVIMYACVFVSRYGCNYVCMDFCTCLCVRACVYVSVSFCMQVWM